MSVFKIQVQGTYDLDYRVNATTEQEAIDKVLNNEVQPQSTTLVDIAEETLDSEEFVLKFKVTVPNYIVYTDYEVFAADSANAIIEAGKKAETEGVKRVEYTVTPLVTTATQIIENV
jgi:hypothetical protein